MCFLLALPNSKGSIEPSDLEEENTFWGSKLLMGAAEKKYVHVVYHDAEFYLILGGRKTAKKYFSIC